ncbi:enoyl-CoA hydratase/isomerase family protein [Zhongshania aquimaris]|uniref:Enoyl-CoA hydratase/isomerase family protein n=1 Tax=Zhongshania aquimaris TaxID=2857107 RepID=A0ABS6VNM3_9GAMM|nr:enoyl-CoA hydratase/isomerase family protein [Zhongshania aquimaris]MBW2939912.1 enoyl-CoA hydratase/isomerase family protein [Zhongshania aquimaris]
MNYQEILFSRDGHVAIITLNRPDKLNAYTPDMGEELVHALRFSARDSAINAIVITGQGSAFCAGADTEYLKGKRGHCGKLLGEEDFIANFTQEFASLPLLTIAAINGTAAGIGLTGMLAADIRIAATDSKLVFNFAELGILPGLGSSYFLPHLIGEPQAKQLLLSDRRLNGKKAEQLGLVNEAVPSDQVLLRALEIARGVDACKTNMVAYIKRALSAGCESSLEQALANEKTLSNKLKQANEVIQ